MQLRTDAIGHFDSPTEENIHEAVKYSGEGSEEGYIVKLMIDEEHYISIWTGRRSVGHRLIFRSGPWQAECIEKLSSEKVVDLMTQYLHNDLSSLKELQWTRPIEKIFLDNLMKLKKHR